jgi:hypothetical protein
MVQTYIDVLPLSQTATAAVTAKRFIGYGGAHAAAAAATMGVARTGAAIGEDFTAGHRPGHGRGRDRRRW